MTTNGKSGIAIFWLRRDLRLQDNAGLWHALQSGRGVIPVFIFDTQILDHLTDRSDCRVRFIYQEIRRLKSELESVYGSTLHVIHGNPLEVIPRFAQSTHAGAVYANADYEPYARTRDIAVGKLLQKQGVAFHLYKDHVIFEADEILKADGKPYTVFTPYSKQWLARLTHSDLKVFRTDKVMGSLLPSKPVSMPSLAQMGLSEKRDCIFTPRTVSTETLKTYAALRDIPAAQGTSRLGVHLRFGTVSTRQLVAQAQKASATFLNELIWREFFQQILWNFPHVVDQCFKPQYEEIQWRNNEAEFAVWCEGRTGYPLVDAGMRELNATGYMHNRVRMVVASFLTKHLLIDWRWGEAYFAEKLLDYELASNNGNWQWAAGTGCDAAPYFRIFNPTEQARKFDPDGKYIRTWVPEIDTLTYPRPIVDHQTARVRALRTYKDALTIQS